ncbi:ATP synthase subunit beta [Amylibacter marinus]|uniref:ATP synthase subunit beta n=2 Tax=Amylibacter marinus TaxID=1475483 RepID=A0ABQ5VRV8_9RHOB|nr:ATP synthase subunit beta [Amylibacter marinus]
MLAILLRQISRFGPMSVAEYMTQCLLHPTQGYYTNTDPIGAQGDFITAPEISQMFGEVIGLCLAQTWLDQGAPDPFCLAELGPGNGTLMQDILRATKSVPQFHHAMRIHLIEASPTLRQRQKECLADFEVSWGDNIAELPDLPLYLVANEFFDCLPVRQFRKTDKGWQEQMIGAEGEHLHFVLGGLAPDGMFPDRLRDSMIEISPSATALCAAIADHIAALSGAALIIDYGTWGEMGDSFQAIKGQKKISPLADPGRADLTAHVNFRTLADAAQSKAQVSELVPQGLLLERLGITQRAQSLAQNMRPQELEAHISAHRRLTHPEEMGQLFKALAITPRGSKQPAGFSE